MKRTMINKLNNYIDKKVTVKGWIHRIRKLKSITFIVVRDRTGLLQCVADNKKIDCENMKCEDVVSIEGLLVKSRNDLNPFELQIESVEILNTSEVLPIEINKENLDVNLDTMLNNRMLSLRNKKEADIFKVQNAIVDGFRKFLKEREFTEIFSPKIIKEGVEGGTELFEVKYFENKAYLAQSPQFYKQMMVGAGFERVFEVAQVYRAEEHNTNRHLNEYVSMDLEMGFIDDEYDLMKLEEEMIKYIIEKIKDECSSTDGIEKIIPKIKTEIPKIDFNDVISILADEYNKADLAGDLDPDAEKLICKYAKEKYNSEFVFVTNYPRKKRPMYTMMKGENGTHSFDLLCRGTEITTGGQRIHNYNMLVENMKYKNLDPENYKSYLENFRYGMIPHGGLAIGLERITSKFLNLDDIRRASFVPRDRTRLVP